MLVALSVDVCGERTKVGATSSDRWPAARFRRSIPFVGHLNNGILFNWSIALGAWALGGPMWAAITFLTVALARVSLESQALRHESGELRRRLLLTGGPFGFSEVDSESTHDAPPISETRLSSVPIEPPRVVSGV